MNLGDHPHVKGTYITVEANREGGADTVIVVQTDLVLDPLNPRHDEAAIGNLLECIREYQAANPDAADRIRLQPENVF
jgi:hypothetical protein